jgi:hypothetical protein
LLSVASLGKEPVCNNTERSKSLSNHTLQSIPPANPLFPTNSIGYSFAKK